MNRNIALSAAILTVLVSTAAAAQPPWGRHGTAPGQRIERMTERLDLTPEQQADIRAILETQRVRQDAERAAVREQIDAVLTEQQRAERDARHDRRIERRAARIADRLDLTPEQETALRTALAEKRGNPSLNRSGMRERLSNELTDDQLAELEQMHSQRGRRYLHGCKE